MALLHSMGWDWWSEANDAAQHYYHYFDADPGLGFTSGYGRTDSPHSEASCSRFYVGAVGADSWRRALPKNCYTLIM